MPRFVILEHDHPVLHWDLMIESGDVLRTWRLSAPPDADVEAERIGDHRRAYLDYEGPVGGGRGTVKRWDVGTCVVESDDEGRLAVRFAGERLKGVAVIESGRLRSGTEGEQECRSGRAEQRAEQESPEDLPPRA